MSIVPITSDLPHPPAVYSQAVRVGNLVFVAGQAGVDFATGKIADDFDTQARQAFENLSTVLRASHSSLARVVKTTVWPGDATQFESMNRLCAEYFPKAQLQISIEAIAVTGE